jgi:Mor family transcriptional regulator
MLDGITIGGLPERYRYMAGTLGIGAFRQVIRSFGGTMIYAPQTREVVKGVKYRRVAEGFDGGNAAGLALRFGLSGRAIYNVARERRARW